MSTETVRVFSTTTTYVAIAIALFVGVQAYFFISAPLPLWLKFLFSSIMLSSIVLIFSFKTAQIRISEHAIVYASGCLRKKILYCEISEAQIIHEKDFPKMAYKIWAYYAFGEKNGLFKLENGKKAYIAGTSPRYLNIVTQNFEAAFAIGEKGLSEEAAQEICLKVEKLMAS